MADTPKIETLDDAKAAIYSNSATQASLEEALAYIEGEMYDNPLDMELAGIAVVGIKVLKTLKEHGLGK